MGISTRLLRLRDKLIPLLDEHLQVLVDVRLELPHRFRGKGVRYNLSLPRVLHAIPRIEEAAADGDECIIERTTQGRQLPCSQNETLTSF